MSMRATITISTPYANEDKKGRIRQWLEDKQLNFCRWGYVNTKYSFCFDIKDMDITSMSDTMACAQLAILMLREDIWGTITLASEDEDLRPTLWHIDSHEIITK